VGWICSFNGVDTKFIENLEEKTVGKDSTGRPRRRCMVA
jgi:hypothetical protein